MLPIIKSGAFDLAFVEREAEWLDQVQRRACRQARSPGVSRVPVNLRVNENDVSGR
jgi:hypothetical protein